MASQGSHSLLPTTEWNLHRSKNGPVVHPQSIDGAPSAGFDSESGRDLGSREPKLATSLLENAAELLSSSFVFKQHGITVTQEQIKALPLLLEEVIALRLYTGPMFTLYNGVLRAWGNTEQPGVVSRGPNAGMDVRGKFTTTIHAINSGILKLSRLQPASPVFRGASALKLPRRFLQHDSHNTRGGVEFGFMSTTLERDVALHYAKSGNPQAPSTVIESSMGMVDRGASLDWLSQYPHEREILWPPLTALEVLDIYDEQSKDSEAYQIRRVVVRLSCNLVSDTLEKLLGVRKKQTQEILSIATKDLAKMAGAADMRSRYQQLSQLTTTVEAEPADRFADNAFLTGQLNDILSLLPQLGDEMQVMQAHTQCICDLVLTGSDVHSSDFASSAWDGTGLLWQLNEHCEYRNVRATTFCDSDASMALEWIDGCLISGQVNGSIAVHQMKHEATAIGSANHALVSGQSDAVVALASLSQTGTDVDDTAQKLLASGDAVGRVMLWSFNDETEARQSIAEHVSTEHGHTSAISAMLWICDPQGTACLVTASFDRRILVWSLHTQAQDVQVRLQTSICDQTCPVCSAAGSAHQGAVTALAKLRAADGAEHFASGCEDGGIKIWSISGQLLHTVRAQENRSTGVCSLAWITNPPDTSPGHLGWLAIGNGDSTIVVIDLEALLTDDAAVAAVAPVCTLTKHTGAVHALLWIPERGWLVSGASDHTIRTWRIGSAVTATPVVTVGSTDGEAFSF